ncbi:MAG: pirin family protein [Alphaproteobacteria bacterium]|nr:pirin family protein [Alphaproteobacteria bacterium]
MAEARQSPFREGVQDLPLLGRRDRAPGRGSHFVSWQPSAEPNAGEVQGCDWLEQVIRGRPRDLGGFTVRRVLPSSKRRTVGPFIFFDQAGPAELGPGQAIDVRPHPHIGLATVTYLFEGELLHRDNLGSAQVIRPGDINWMTAGSGIVHSERSTPEAREKTSPLSGIQTWVALPKAMEETAPGFFHHPKATLPRIEEDGICLRLLLGSLYGKTSPVKTLSETLYADVSLESGATLIFPAENEERGIYLASGEIEIGGENFADDGLLVLCTRDALSIRAKAPSRLLLIGGTAPDGPRFLWWNFVSSSEARIERAKKDWKEGRFGTVPGDAEEFIPLPE